MKPSLWRAVMGEVAVEETEAVVGGIAGRFLVLK
jgi:hypothetical protein